MHPSRLALAALLCGPLACSSGPDSADAAHQDARGGSCTIDCDDGLFCNGLETCASDDCAPGARPCPAGCDEAADRCDDGCPDADADGATDAACGGDDCDDSDASRHPAALEVCDDDDEDCDDSTFAGASDGDFDADGYVSNECCNAAESDGEVVCGLDCDDSSAGVFPTVLDDCNAIDDDCDGVVDEDPTNTFYRDVDGDEFGRSDMTAVACTAPPGYSVLSGDCDETRASVHPGALETCDTRDNDCDGNTDPGCPCTLGTSMACGTTDVGACAYGVMTCVMGASAAEWGPCAGSREPGLELCGGEDEDCDGASDESSAVDARTYYRDVDGDSYGRMTGVRACTPPVGYVNRADDCDDGDIDIHPGAVERCNTLDDDCNETIDDRTPACACTTADPPRACGPAAIGVCRPGMQSCMMGEWSGCLGATVPGAETCDEPRDDDDCDGRTDEGLHIGVTTRAWLAMDDLDARCVPGGYCQVAYHLACGMTPAGPGRCAYTTGWGIRDQNSATVDFYCVDATLVSVPWASLAHDCRFATRTDPRCFAAADTACTSAGYVGGFGPLDGDSTLADVRVACLTGAQAMRVVGSYAELSSAQPLCTASSSRYYCENAVQGWCRLRGFFGGFGPVQWDLSVGRADWVCVRDF